MLFDVVFGLFDCDKVTAFFSLTQTWQKISFYSILSICSLVWRFGSAICLKKCSFDVKVSVLDIFCGKSFFGVFLLFSQSIKKI